MSAPLATDLEEAFDRLYAAGAVKDVEAALDAALDIICITSGIVGISERLREIMGRPGRA